MKKLQNLAYAMVAALPNPGVQIGGAPITLSEIEGRIQTVAQFLIVISMVIAVIMIVYGGIRWMVSSDKPEEAKKIITNGIIGAAIILGVGVILQTLSGVITRSFFS